MYTMLTDMAKTTDEIEKEETISVGGPAPMANINRYPYGLCISLDEEDLAKLGMPLDADVGDMIQVAAMARVTSVSKKEMADGTCDCRVELQITHLNLEGDDEDEATEAA